jgi:hypothetical protein
MRLVRLRDLKVGDRKYVYAPAEALKQIKKTLANFQKIEGLEALRRGLPVNLDQFAWQQIERGEWLLIKAEARSFDWKDFEKEASHQKVMALLEDPPVQVKPPQLIFRMFDSETGEPIVNRRYFGRFDGESGERRVDAQGFGNLPVSSKRENISVGLRGDY